VPTAKLTHRTGISNDNDGKEIATMRKWLPYVGRLCVWAVFCGVMLALVPTAHAADAEVGFKLKNITLDGTKVLLHGEFVNDSDKFITVTGLSLRYIISDEDGYPMLTGGCMEKELSVPVGKTPVAHTIETNNENAVIYSSNDVFFWRIESVVTIE